MSETPNTRRPYGSTAKMLGFPRWFASRGDLDLFIETLPLSLAAQAKHFPPHTKQTMKDWRDRYYDWLEEQLK